MNCVIYKGNKKADTFLYICEEGDFSAVPEQLLALLGELELVMHLELVPQRRLARADAAQVREALATHGFYVQMPPQDQATLDAFEDGLKHLR